MASQQKLSQSLLNYNELEEEEKVAVQESSGPLRIVIDRDATDTIEKQESESPLSSTLFSIAEQTEDDGKNAKLGVFDAIASGIGSSVVGPFNPERLYKDIEPYPVEAFSPRLRPIYLASKSAADNIAIGALMSIPIFRGARFASTYRGAAQQAAQNIRLREGTGTFIDKFTDIAKPMIDAAASSPGAVVMAELGAIAGGAQMRAFSEMAFPGNETAGVLSEMAGAFVNPAGAFVRGVGGATNGIVGVAKRLSGKGRFDSAAEWIRLNAINNNEDPNELLAAYRAGRYAEIPSLPGYGIESPTLNSVWKFAAKKDPDLRNIDRARLEDFQRNLFQQIDGMIASGDPMAIRMAEQMRRDYFDQQAQRLMDNALTEAEAAVSRITRNASPEEAARAAREASDSVKAELTEIAAWATQVQNEMWPKALRQLDMSPAQLQELDVEELYSGTMDIVLKINERALPGEEIGTTFTRLYGSDVGKSLQRLSEIETPQPREMYNLVKTINDSITTAQNLGNATRVQALSEAKEAILNDIYQLDPTLLGAAMDFTRAYRGVFERTFAATAVPRTDAQKARATSGALLDATFSGKPAKRLANVEALENAADFNVPDAPQRVPTGWKVRNDIEAYILSNASKFVKNGRVDAAALARFVESNREVIARYPDTAEILKSAESTELALRELERSQDLINRNVANVNVFNRVMDATPDTINRVMTDIFTSDRENVAQQVSTLIRDQYKDQPDKITAAREGFVASIIEQATLRSKNSENGINYLRFREILSEDTIDVLVKNNLLSSDSAERLNSILNRGAEIQRAIDNPAEMAIDLGDIDMTALALARGLGAQSYRKLMGLLGLGEGAGPSLVIAQAGANAFERKLAWDPFGKVTEVIIEAHKNPEMYERLLARAASLNDKVTAKRNLKSISNAFYAAGITPDYTEEELDYIFGGVETLAQNVGELADTVAWEARETVKDLITDPADTEFLGFDTPKDQAIMIKNLADLEGDTRRAYVPRSSSNRENRNRSGVTIGRGVDLGNLNLAESNLSPELYQKVQKYYGVYGKEAELLLKENPLRLTVEEIEDLNNAAYNIHRRELGEQFQRFSGTAFEELSPGQKSVLMSVKYQYGNLPQRTPNFWRYVTNKDWEKAIQELENFGDAFPTRRKKEAAILKREMESNPEFYQTS